MPSHVVVHYLIDELMLHSLDMEILHKFLDCISLPSFRRLLVKNGDEELASRSLASFFKQSSSPLERLDNRHPI